MKWLLIVAMSVLLAGAAAAQSWSWYGGAMGVYFSDTEFTAENTNLVTDANPFDFYVVLRDAQVATIGGYECGIEISEVAVFILAVTGPNGWTNFGHNTNHLVGYQVPVPVDANGNVVLCTMMALYVLGDPVDIIMGPSSPSTGDPNNNPWGYSWNGPVIGEGADPNHLLCCHLTSGAADYPDVVATLNGVVVATETRNWSQIRTLFD